MTMLAHLHEDGPCDCDPADVGTLDFRREVMIVHRDGEVTVVEPVPGSAWQGAGTFDTCDRPGTAWLPGGGVVAVRIIGLRHAGRPALIRTRDGEVVRL